MRIDLTQTPSSQLQTAAFEVIRDLPRGGHVELVCVDEPSMTLHSLNLRLRNNLSWSLTCTDTGHWVAEIHRAEDVPPTDIINALTRDHKRLDALFSQVIHLTDQGHMTLAAHTMQTFVNDLQRHLGVEHDMLVPAIRTPPNAMGGDLSATMVADHHEILQQSAMILAAFDEPDADASSVSPLLAILAGYLSKHEIREELSVFPIWSGALSRAPESARSVLFERVLNQLEMNPHMPTLKKQALDYHEFPKPGKLSVNSSKPCDSVADLALAYSPGVAEPVRAIAQQPQDVWRYTNKGNLVAVITDGTAILGLGNLGPLAAKPVMEGKAVLFKRFANIDVFDIEINAPSVEAFIETVVNISPTFGGINLEDIAAPHCFEIEKELSKRLDIPVFHDDQHGTAVIICAGLINALHVQGKQLADARIVCLGAGAAGTASLNLLMAMGATKANILVVDKVGVLHTGMANLPPHHQMFAADTQARSLADAMHGADAFIGVSAGNLVTGDMLRSMAEQPVVFALANPDPEIRPEDALAARDDVIIATGRSDYPNQVNNVLGFPFIFRGALDARAKRITQAMQIAAVEALAALAREPVPDSVLTAYQLEHLSFGRDYILPKPFDPRLLERVAGAVARAATAQ